MIPLPAMTVLLHSIVRRRTSVRTDRNLAALFVGAGFAADVLKAGGDRVLAPLVGTVLVFCLSSIAAAVVRVTTGHACGMVFACAPVANHLLRLASSTACGWIGFLKAIAPRRSGDGAKLMMR